jgi:flavin-dependent dehydrogenase
VCGEFVSAESLQLLESLVGSKKRNYPEIESARLFLGKRIITLPVKPAARSIPRFELDAQLFAAARQTGVCALETTPVRDVRWNGLFVVETPSQKFTSRCVTNTTGRWSQLTRKESLPQEKWIGLKAHFCEAAPSQSVDLYFFTDGYCGVTPVSSNTVNACAMVRAGSARNMDEVLGKHPELAERSRGWMQLFSDVTTAPLYFRRSLTRDRGMTLAGDSAGFIDPFAGDGISLALHSGALAAESMLAALKGNSTLEEAQARYQTEYERRFAPAFRSASRMRALLALPPWLLSTLARAAELGPVGNLLVRSTRAG